MEIEESKSKYTRIEVMLSSSETVHCCYSHNKYKYTGIDLVKQHNEIWQLNYVVVHHENVFVLYIPSYSVFSFA